MVTSTTQPRTWVPFTAGEDRTGPASWGQAKMFRDLDEFFGGKSLAYIPLVVPVPPGTSLAGVLHALGALVSAHDALRTRYPSRRVQEVLGSGRLAVDLVEAADPREAADRVVAGYGSTEFDLSHDLPLRCAVILTGGSPVLVAAAVSHVVVDGIAVNILAARLTALLDGRDPATLEPDTPTWQPLDLARYQYSPAGQRQSAEALTYWESAYRRTPTAMLADPVRPLAQRTYRRGHLISPGIGAALPVAAGRLRVGRSTVLLAACSALFGLLAGTTRCVLTSIAANRTVPETERYIGQIAQDALILVDLDATTFDEVVRRALVASLTAYAHSQIDPEAQTAVRERVARERGARYQRDCVYNDHGAFGAPANAADHAVAPGGHRPEPVVRVEDDVFIPVRAYLTVLRTDEVAKVLLWADTAYIPDEDIVAFLLGLDRLVTAVADSTVPMAELSRVSGVRRAGTTAAQARR